MYRCPFGTRVCTRHRRHLAPRDDLFTRSVRSWIFRPQPRAGRDPPTVVVRTHAQSEVFAMLAFTPTNGHSHRILDLLTAQPQANNQKPQPRHGARSPNGENGETSTDPTPDHGYLTVITVKPRRIPAQDHGYVTVITVNPPRTPRPRLPNGDNGETARDPRPRPRLPNGDNGETTRDRRPGPRLPNGDNGEVSVVPRQQLGN
jgi:hypothetical protein